MSQYLGPHWSICHNIYINRKLWMSRVYIFENNLDVASAVTTIHNTRSYQCHIWKKRPKTHDLMTSLPHLQVWYTTRFRIVISIWCCCLYIYSMNLGGAQTTVNAISQLICTIGPYMAIWSSMRLYNYAEKVFHGAIHIWRHLIIMEVPKNIVPPNITWLPFKWRGYCKH